MKIIIQRVLDTGTRDERRCQCNFTLSCLFTYFMNLTGLSVFLCCCSAVCCESAAISILYSEIKPKLFHLTNRTCNKFHWRQLIPYGKHQENVYMKRRRGSTFYVAAPFYWALYLEQFNKASCRNSLQCCYIWHCPLSEMHLVNIRDIFGIFRIRILLSFSLCWNLLLVLLFSIFILAV